MGMRLDGAALACDAASQEIISGNATVPGSIQVPGSGYLPIVLLADGRTAGGYPKRSPPSPPPTCPGSPCAGPATVQLRALVTVPKPEALARAAGPAPRPFLPASRAARRDGIDLGRSTHRKSHRRRRSNACHPTEARVTKGHGEPLMQLSLNAGLGSLPEPGRWATMRRCWRSSIRPTSPRLPCRRPAGDAQHRARGITAAPASGAHPPSPTCGGGWPGGPCEWRPPNSSPQCSPPAPVRSPRWPRRKGARLRP